MSKIKAKMAQKMPAETMKDMGGNVRQCAVCTKKGYASGKVAKCSHMK